MTETRRKSIYIFDYFSHTFKNFPLNRYIFKDYVTIDEIHVRIISILAIKELTIKIVFI
jgi:hypothetical protein